MEHETGAGHRWAQMVARQGWVNEICLVGGCATKRTRRVADSEWELICGLCDRVLEEGRLAGPCAACLSVDPGR